MVSKKDFKNFDIMRIVKLIISVMLAFAYFYMLYKSIPRIIRNDGCVYPSFLFITLWCGSIFLITVIIKKIGVLKMPPQDYMVPILLYIISVTMKLICMGVL